MSVSDKQHSSFGGELQSEMSELVSDGIRRSSDALLRSLKLAKAIVTQIPQQRATGIGLVERWARFNLEASRIISKHSQQAVDEILDILEDYGLLEPTSDMPHTQTREHTQTRMEMNLSARKGKNAQASFIVANPGKEKMEISFSVTDFVNEDGHVIPAAEVQFSPTTFELPPQQETAVQISVKVDQKFKVDKIYRAKLRLSGHPNKEVALKLHVLRSARTRPRTSEGRKTQKKESKA